MKTITAVLEPDADGTLHLPLPPELRNGKVRVEAKVEAIADTGAQPNLSNALATPEMVRERRAAFENLRALGGLKDIIPDPMAWQREQRQDRSLPGRD